MRYNNKQMNDAMFSCILELAKVDHAAALAYHKKKRKERKNKTNRVRFSPEVKIHRYDKEASVEKMSLEIKKNAEEEAAFWAKARSHITPRSRSREKRRRNAEAAKAHPYVTPRSRARLAKIISRPGAAHGIGFLG